MKRMLGTLLGALAAAAIATTAMAAIDAPEAGQPAAAPQAATLDIVDTAVGAGNFTTLAKALQAAGLVDTLKGPGPFTVFAPTDAAFAALPAGTLDALLADPAALKAVLLYHVVPGRVASSDVATLSEATTVGGAKIAIATGPGGVTLNGSAKVTTADVAASNGVIHVIDAVLIPPAQASTPAPAAAGNAGLGGSSAVAPVMIALLALGALALAGGARLVTARRR